MKFSKSILIFLFFSSVSGAFFYALHRTNGNVFKSLQFALYWLAIKSGLIGANLPLKLDQDQPTQQLVSRVGYNPYVSILDDYHPSGLLMDSIERSSLVSQYSYSQNAINELRAGDSRVRQAAWFLITIWILQHQGVGFQPIKQIPLPPHIQEAHNVLFGKPKPDQLSCQQLSRFDPQEFEKMDLYSSEIMSQEEALALITQEYGTLQNPKFDYIDESLGLRATRQQLAAKSYHAPLFKVQPELYNIDNDPLKVIRKYGLVGYVQRGGQLPSSEFIYTYYQNVKSFFARNKDNINFHASYRGEPAIAVHNEETREILIFKPATKELWTPHRLKEAAMNRYVESGGIGKKSLGVAPGTLPPPIIE